MGDVKFIRKNGHVVPIRSGASGHSAGRAKPQSSTRVAAPHKGYQAAATALSVAAGALSAFTLIGSPRKILVGQGASIGLDVTAAGLNVAAYKGKRPASARLAGIARDEAFNQAVGWGTFGALVLANPATRKGGIDLVKRGVSVVGSILKRVK